MDFNHFNHKENTSVLKNEDGYLPKGDSYNLPSFKKCQKAHIGPHNQFTANVVNIAAPLPDMKLKRPFITRRGYLIAGSFFLLLSLIVTFLIIYIFVLKPDEKIYQNGNNSTQTSQPNVTQSTQFPHEKTSITDSGVTQSPEVPHEELFTTDSGVTQSPEVPHEKTNTSDSGVTQSREVPQEKTTTNNPGERQTTPHQEPAIDWFLTNEQWGGPKPTVKCAKNVLSDVIKVDNLKIGSCNSMEECVKVIKGVKTLDSNFLIGNDGHVYENRGWKCLSNNNEDIYDLNHSIKISFIGDYTKKKLTDQQQKLFHLLIQDGIKEIVLRKKNYMLFRTCEGTDIEIISFLRRESHYHKDTCLR